MTDTDTTRENMEHAIKSIINNRGDISATTAFILDTLPEVEILAQELREAHVAADHATRAAQNANIPFHATLRPAWYLSKPVREADSGKMESILHDYVNSVGSSRVNARNDLVELKRQMLAYTNPSDSWIIEALFAYALTAARAAATEGAATRDVLAIESELEALIG